VIAVEDLDIIPSREEVVEAYNGFFTEHQHKLAHYFRTLYRVFKFIDESEIEKKQQYASIMRAQLSSYELALLFYNCLGRAGNAFVKLAEKYALFENIDPDDLIRPQHVSFLGRSAFGVLDVGRYFEPAAKT
jgi:hypothetical protein